MSGTYQDGAPIPGLYPMDPNAVLASVAAASGVPTPTSLAFTTVATNPVNTAVPLLAANPSRSFLLVYNPNILGAQFSKGIAQQGLISNLAIGPDQAFFQATAQGLGPAYQGPLTVVGQAPWLSIWAWEDAANLYNDGGVLALTAAPPGYPTSPVGLPHGALWNNGLTIAVIPGIVPNPAAPPIYFGMITAQDLLAAGGGNLPLSNPGAGTLQLWNDGGMIAIA